MGDKAVADLKVALQGLDAPGQDAHRLQRL